VFFRGNPWDFGFSVIDVESPHDLSSLAIEPVNQSLLFFVNTVGGGSVNKNELVDAVATATELKKSEATKAVDSVFDAITAALKKGDDVRLVGFGTFSVASRAASEGRNPRTGEKIKIAASKQAKFKPGKTLKDELN
jgi:DNA-binding protein HU-beta